VWRDASRSAEVFHILHGESSMSSGRLSRDALVVGCSGAMVVLRQ